MNKSQRFLLVLAAAGTLSLAACGSDNGPNSDTKTPPATTAMTDKMDDKMEDKTTDKMDDKMEDKTTATTAKK